MKRIVFLFLILTLSACAAQATLQPTPTISAPFVLKQEENLYATRSEDLNLKQDGIILTSASLSERYDLTPIRPELHVLGSMPSVCSELRINVNPPDENYRLFIEIHSLVNPNSKCENVFQQFEASILLGVYSIGRYTVWINETLIGDFSMY